MISRIRFNAFLTVTNMWIATCVSSPGMSAYSMFLAACCYVFFFTDASSVPAYALRRRLSHAR